METGAQGILKPTRLSKEEFLGILSRISAGDKISWLVTGVRTFDWGDLNGNRERALEDLCGLDFAAVWMGLVPPGRRGGAYRSFEISA